jgi:site-specific DNA-methyltransferase (adenine-specific)
MSKTIEEILAPKPKARPRIYAYAIADAAHDGSLKVGQTTRNVKQRVAEQLKTAAIVNYTIELDESAERDDGGIITDHAVRDALRRKGFANPQLEWMQCTVADVKTVLAELRTGQQFTGTHHEDFPPRTEHSWQGTKCEFCGAPRALFDRGPELENHAYAFIHTNDIKARIGELFGADMQFDVIIGNPPYQMTGGAGGTSDSSIYHLFVEQAFNLEPRYVSMVVPSRWMAGGRGMDEFRAEMLSSAKLAEIVDFPVSKDVFPGVEVKGGICYFLWERAHTGRTNVTTIRGDEVIGPVARDLGEFDVFVRDPRAVDILHKVQAKAERSITEILTGDTPFGIATNFDDYRDAAKAGDVALHLVKSGKRLVGYMPRADIKKNTHLIDSWKVLTPKAGSDGGQKIPDVVLGKTMVVAPGSVCTQTFIAFWVSSEAQAKSLQSYYCTKFFRFLVSLRKITQDSLRGTYTWVPQQAWNCAWTDQILYKKYGLTRAEIDYVEEVIKPMAASHE